MTQPAAPLSRTPSGDGRLGMIEAGRALAALAVVLFHADTIVTTNIAGAKGLPLLGLGERGVDFFFVLSGFIITLVHAGDIGRPDRLKRFAWRRWSRIYPILWIVVAGTTAMNVVLDGELYGAAKLWTSFTLWPSMVWPTPSVAWTLRHEIIFYALFGLLVLSRRWGGVVAFGWLGMTLLQTGLLLAGTSLHGLPAMLFSPLNLQFTVGCGVALAHRRFGARYWQGALLLGLSLLVIAAWAKIAFALPGRTVMAYESPVGVTADLVAGLLFGLVVFGLAGASSAVRTGRFVLLLGASSYALYLVHTPVLGLTGRFLPKILPHGFLLSGGAYVLLVAAAVAVGLLTHLVFEKPIARWLNRRFAPPLPQSTQS